MTLRMFYLTLQVFNNLHNQNQELLVQNWVMLSLSNFTQRTPVSMATWSLTCFFISASTNSWLRPLYPFVRLYRHHTVALLDIMNIKSIHKLPHSEFLLSKFAYAICFLLSIWGRTRNNGGDQLHEPVDPWATLMHAVVQGKPWWG